MASKSLLLSLSLILILSSFVFAETNPYITYQEMDEQVYQIHGFIEVGDYLFGSTRTTPAHIVRINKTNLTDYQSITFNDSLFNRNIEQLVFINSTNKIYGIFMDVYTYVPAGSSYRTGYGFELDPLTLNTTIFMLFNTTSSYSMGQTPGATTDGTDLIVFSQTFPIRLIKINTSSHTIKSTTEYAGYSSGHSIIYDQETNTLFGSTTEGQLFKINNSNPSSYELVYIGGVLTDDMCIKDNYVYLGNEGQLGGEPYLGDLHIVNKNNISDYESINTSISASAYGAHCNREIFVSYATSPGTLLKYNATSQEEDTLVFDTGYDEVNEALVVDGKIFVTFWGTNPAVIASLNYSDWENATAWEPTAVLTLSEEIEEEANNTNQMIFSAFSLLALAVIVGAAFMIIKMSQEGADTSTIMILTISAIALGIVLIIGIYVLGTLANIIS